MSEPRLDVVYIATLKILRSSLRKDVENGIRAYKLLVNKESTYSRSIKAILELQEAALKIYDDAPDVLVTK